jgi:hypothetical protein
VTLGIALDAGVTQDDDAGRGVGGGLEETKVADDAGSLGVVVFVGDPEAGGSGVADYEVGTEFPGTLEHRVDPRAVVGEDRRLTYAEVGGERY